MSQPKFDPSALNPGNQPIVVQSAGNSGWLQTLLIVGAVLVGFWWFSQGKDNDDRDDDRPKPVAVATQAEAAAREFIAQVGRNSRTVAAGVRDGHLKTVADIVKESKARWTATHGKYIQVTGQLDNEYFPDEVTDDNRDELADYLDQFGIGVERVAK